MALLNLQYHSLFILPPPPFAFFLLSFSWRWASFSRFVCWPSASLALRHHFLAEKWLQTLKLSDVRIQILELLICTCRIMCGTQATHVYARSENHTGHWNDETSLSEVNVSPARIFHHGIFFINHTKTLRTHGVNARSVNISHLYLTSVRDFSESHNSCVCLPCKSNLCVLSSISPTVLSSVTGRTLHRPIWMKGWVTVLALVWCDKCLPLFLSTMASHAFLWHQFPLV